MRDTPHLLCKRCGLRTSWHNKERLRIASQSKHLKKKRNHCREILHNRRTLGERSLQGAAVHFVSTSLLRCVWLPLHEAGPPVSQPLSARLHGWRFWFGSLGRTSPGAPGAAAGVGRLLRGEFFTQHDHPVIPVIDGPAAGGAAHTALLGAGVLLQAQHRSSEEVRASPVVQKWKSAEGGSRSCYFLTSQSRNISSSFGRRESSTSSRKFS